MHPQLKTPVGGLKSQHGNKSLLLDSGVECVNKYLATLDHVVINVQGLTLKTMIIAQWNSNK